MSLQWLQEGISLVCSCVSYFWYHSVSHVVPLFTSSQPICIQPGFVNVCCWMSLRSATAQLWSEVGNWYLPLCSEITWQFSIKRRINQILLGMLRLLKVAWCCYGSLMYYELWVWPVICRCCWLWNVTVKCWCICLRVSGVKNGSISICYYFKTIHMKKWKTKTFLYSGSYNWIFF